jgi:protoporphyrinogen oxidase
MGEKHHAEERIAILGAGVSGLALAWMLSATGKRVTVFEAAPFTGGLARTFYWHDLPCDLAPHRLHTHDKQILAAIQGLVPLREHKRNSRILMKDKQIQDPINPIELLLRFPPLVGLKLVWGFLFRPRLPETSFEALALNRYGRGLYDFFFEPYTKKMFGASPAEISVVWGREKLRSSGLLDAIKRQSKTFFHTFWYPTTGGYGTICDEMVKRTNGDILLSAPVTGLRYNGDRVDAVRYQQDGEERVFECDRVFSTIPATVLARMFGASLDLRFKAIQLVYLHIAKPFAMPYHWVYWGDGDVVINRMAEFKHFHPDLPHSDRTVLCAEVTVDTEHAGGGRDPRADSATAWCGATRSWTPWCWTRTLSATRSTTEGSRPAKRPRRCAVRSLRQPAPASAATRSFKHIETDEDIASAAEKLQQIYGSEFAFPPSPKHLVSA